MSNLWWQLENGVDGAWSWYGQLAGEGSVEHNEREKREDLKKNIKRGRGLITVSR
jgi:hypothetical protein